MFKLSEKTVALFTTGMLAATISLTGCGGSKPEAQNTAATETQATQSQTQGTQAEEQKTDAAATTTTTTEAAPAPAPTQESAANYIGDAAAKQAALAHAGFSEADVFDLECELDLDDGVAHYDVDFKSGNMEYEYDIDATTGAVIKSKSEVDD